MKTNQFLFTVSLGLVLALPASAVSVQVQRAATAWSTLDTNGAVTAITLTDGGGGYASPPSVVLGGGGGSNALAQASLTNGAVAAITVLNGGPAIPTPPPSASPRQIARSPAWRCASPPEPSGRT